VAALLPAPAPHDPAASSPVTPIDIDSLVASVSGTVIRPDDEAYDEARRIHNTLIDRKPSLIVSFGEIRRFSPLRGGVMPASQRML